MDVISGRDDMIQERKAYNQKVLLGCGALFLLASLFFGVSLGTAVHNNRQLGRYPGAIPIVDHSNYSALPAEFRWDNSYRTSDPFPDVYEWYSINFELGTEARALGECILLEGSQKQLAWRQYTSVFLCDTPRERLIYITRSISLR